MSRLRQNLLGRWLDDLIGIVGRRKKEGVRFHSPSVPLTSLSPYDVHDPRHAVRPCC